MHLLFVPVGEVYDEPTFRELRLNSPVGGWFPALRRLDWAVTESNLPYANLFFSPHLKKISIRSWFSENSDAPRDILSAVTSIIPALPVFALQSLELSVRKSGRVPGYLKDAFSPLVLRCGPSLTEFSSLIPLSDAAMDHLIQLPHLHIYLTASPPPTYSAPLPPLILSPLTQLTLKEGTAQRWFSLFEHLEHGVSTARSVAPLSKVKESLTNLTVEDHPGTIINASFTTTIQTFRNLVDLRVDISCRSGRNYECAFKLNNHNVAEFAMALPQLRDLLLGRPCSRNTCATTAACLLPISIHCTGLRLLQIHFNTRNIIDDIKNIRGDPRFQELHSRPRCALSHLTVANTRLGLSGPDLDIVGSGLIDIFPSLVGEFNSPWECDMSWYKLHKRIRELQGR